MYKTIYTGDAHPNLIMPVHFTYLIPKVHLGYLHSVKTRGFEGVNTEKMSCR